MERGEELMELNRAAAERNTEAFERLMACFDRHEKAFEKHEEAFEKHEEVFERVTAALDRHEAQTDDLKIFIRDQNRRSEKVIQEMLRRNDELHKEESLRTDRIVARLDDITDEQKAQRQALLAIIDRLPPPAQAA